MAAKVNPSSNWPMRRTRVLLSGRALSTPGYRASVRRRCVSAGDSRPRAASIAASHGGPLLNRTGNLEGFFLESESPQPSDESDRDTLNRCVVFQHAASGRARTDRTPRDANGRRWPAGPAPTLRSTEASTVATRARADDQMRERVDVIERGCPIGAAGLDSRAGGLFASLRPIGRPRPFGRRAASLVPWPASALTSNDSCLDDVLARDSSMVVPFAHEYLALT